jgi:hypothetical protein
MKLHRRAGGLQAARHAFSTCSLRIEICDSIQPCPLYWERLTREEIVCVTTESARAVARAAFLSLLPFQSCNPRRNRTSRARAASGGVHPGLGPLEGGYPYWERLSRHRRRSLRSIESRTEGGVQAARARGVGTKETTAPYLPYPRARPLPDSHLPRSREAASRRCAHLQDVERRRRRATACGRDLRRRTQGPTRISHANVGDLDLLALPVRGRLRRARAHSGARTCR